MKIHQLALLAAIVSGSSLRAQTKEIAFESHSGIPANFYVSLSNEIFESEESDFGLPVPKDVKSYKLDSVIYISDSVSVIVKKEYSRANTDPKDSAKYTRTLTDTLFNDPLFSRNHSLDSIRDIIRKQGFYINAANLRKVVFRGYDNKKFTAKPRMEQHSVPLAITVDKPNNHPPFDGTGLWILTVILMLSALGGWLSWKLYRPSVR